MEIKKSKSLRVLAAVTLNLVFFGAWTFIFEPLNDFLAKNQPDSMIVKAGMLRKAISSDYISENQTKIDVLHYNIKIDLYPEKESIKGEVIIRGRVIEKYLGEIDLNFYENMEISRLDLNGNPVKYDRDETKLTVPLNKTGTDTFEIRITYSGKPRRMGFDSFAFDKFKNKSVVYTLNEPVFASTWFPCNDKPDDKALVDMWITNDSSKVSLSNGKLVNVETKNNRKTFHWQTMYPISTYLICMYSADYRHFREKYTSRNNEEMNIEYYAFPEHFEMAKIDYSGHPEMITFFAGLFGEYPFIKEKYGVAEFLWQMGAMEHQTITGIGSNFLNGKRFFNEFYIHELAHQWFGNAVGPATWKDIWLNEGFASYSEALYAEHKSGTDAYKSTMMSKFESSFPGTVYNPGANLFGSTVYDKGAWILHMLRFEVGDSSFFRILKTYYNEFKYKNAATRDFIKICNWISGRDLSYFFNQWLFEGKGSISLEYNWSQEAISAGNYQVIFKYKQTQSGYPVYKFPLELRLIYEDNNENISKVIYVDKRENTVRINAGGKIKDLELDPNNWILMNESKEIN